MNEHVVVGIHIKQLVFNYFIKILTYYFLEIYLIFITKQTSKTA